MHPIILLLIGCLMYPIFQTEVYRYKECQHECFNKHTANVNLLQNEICLNPRKRIQFKNAGTVHCEKAEKDLLLTPTQCAFNMWWKNNELVKLYDRIAGTYWSILGIFLPIILFIIYMIGKSIMQSKSEERFYKQQSKFIKELLPQRQQQTLKQHQNVQYDSSPMLTF